VESEGKIRGYGSYSGEKLVASTRLRAVKKKKHLENTLSVKLIGFANGMDLRGWREGPA